MVLVKTTRRICGDLANRHVRNRGGTADALLQAPQRPAEPRRVARAAAVVVATAVAATGCAAHPRSLASRFVIAGTPAIDVGAGAATRGGGTAAPAPPTGTLPRAVPGRYSGSAAVESASPALQRALLALALAPSGRRYLDVAVAYRRLGIVDTAVDFLLAGLHRDSTDAALHDALARAWRDWGLPDLGLAAAHRAVYHAPESPEARNTLGTVLWALGDRGGAEQAFAMSASLDPGAEYAWRNLCTAALTGGRTQAAVAACRRAAQVRDQKRTPAR
ncbi:MAG: hypothetical protein AB7U83_14910 [Vicinamibacterales bacterium]